MSGDKTECPRGWTIEDLKLWILTMGKFLGPGNFENLVKVESDTPELYRIRIFTRTSVYAIVAKKTGERSYLGCQATLRYWQPGENWNRGSDLADGPLNREIFVEILGDIVTHEMALIEKPVKGTVWQEWAGDAKTSGALPQKVPDGPMFALPPQQTEEPAPMP